MEFELQDMNSEVGYGTASRRKQIHDLQLPNRSIARKLGSLPAFCWSMFPICDCADFPFFSIKITHSFLAFLQMPHLHTLRRGYCSSCCCAKRMFFSLSVLLPLTGLSSDFSCSSFTEFGHLHIPSNYNTEGASVAQSTSRYS